MKKTAKAAISFAVIGPLLGAAIGTVAKLTGDPDWVPVAFAWAGAFLFGAFAFLMASLG